MELPVLSSVSKSRTNEELRAEWRDHVVSPWPWRLAANQAGIILDLDCDTASEGGGDFVQSDGYPGRRAYRKPLYPEEGSWTARAAREKICSDLGYDLDVMVPPVLLSQDVGNPPSCVSLVMYQRQWSWGELKPLIAGGGMGALVLKHFMPVSVNVIARALVFDTWVDQIDHDDHPHNIVFGYEPDVPGSGSYLFLDFAFALGNGGRWNVERRCVKAEFPADLAAQTSPFAIEEAVTALEALEDDRIREVVRRIPVVFMANDEKEAIERTLLERKNRVRGALAS